MRGYWLLEMVFGDKMYRAIIHKDSEEEITAEQVRMAADAFKRQRKIGMPLVSLRYISLDIQVIDVFDKGVGGN